ncbi:hypothetical protein P0O24_07085 [Methanotrichaceae archaeon M04Ac]|uniref:DUF5666 domain-containing protein n=1 Tax=Candidatus Methanocrinis alkalitolerans TaxID=3033395 RepID=A0ABT5XF65_9EURY|nr:hypothetical protein [Candidatus Methanocrinis alkalitolerans]
MVLTVLLLSAGMALAEDVVEEETADVVTVTFSGIAVELFVGEIPGAPTVWAVEVTSVEEEAEVCSEIVNVTVFQATPPPWGTFDENVEAGDEVEVYGAYIEDETGCTVTLQGSEDYYFQAVVVEADEVVDETEVDETEVDETEVDETEVDETEVDETEVDETEVDETEVDETEVDETEVDETEVDETEVDETEVDETEVDETEVDETEVDETEVDETSC